MPRITTLDSIQFFEATARLGRISAAAEELCVSPSAVSQRISYLEQQLGVKLFLREKQRVILTLDGEQLYQTTTKALGMIRDVRASIARKREGRRLIMRVSPSFAVRWLGPRLKDFIDRNPRWDLRIDGAVEFSDFLKETIDLDLRYGSGSWSGLYSECFLQDYVLPVCSPGYLETLRELSPEPREQLHSARLIDSVKAIHRWDEWLNQQLPGAAIRTDSIQLDRSSMAVQLAVDGGGIVLESVTLTIRELAAGQLVPFSNQFPVWCFPAYWMVCPARHLNRRIVKLFSDWLRAKAEDHHQEVATILHRYQCRIETLGMADDQDATVPNTALSQ